MSLLSSFPFLRSVNLIVVSYVAFLSVVRSIVRQLKEQL